MPATKFEHDLRVSTGPEGCWAVLTDVPKLVEWVSIVENAQTITPLESYSATLMDRLGPFKLRADLAITLSEVKVGEQVRMAAAGEDRQVSSRIGVDAVLSLTPVPEGTLVRVVGTYEVVGKVATMGAGMIRQKAAKLIDEFFAEAGAELGEV